jgi:hypothetical protein
VTQPANFRQKTSSYGDVPDGSFAFAAGPVDVSHPFHRLAHAAAGPVERRHAHVPGSLLPLAVYPHQRRRKIGRTRLTTNNNVLQREKKLCSVDDRPGGVAQHMLRSSTCSTSSPSSHAPRDTSSFANLCSTGLRK